MKPILVKAQNLHENKIVEKSWKHREGKSFDRINMTKKFVHDQKDHTDEH